MTKKRTLTPEEKEKRRKRSEEIDKIVYYAAELLANKYPESEIKIKLAKDNKVTIRQASNYVDKARRLLWQSIGREKICTIWQQQYEQIQEDRLLAIKAENWCVVAGLDKTAVKLIELLQSVAQPTMWEAQHDQMYESFVEDKFAPPKGKIPREKISMKDVGKLSPELPDLPLPDDNSIDNIPW
jgi:hypothetical protein